MLTPERGIAGAFIAGLTGADVLSAAEAEADHLRAEVERLKDHAEEQMKLYRESVVAGDAANADAEKLAGALTRLHRWFTSLSPPSYDDMVAYIEHALRQHEERAK